MSDTPLTDAAYISGCYALHTSSEEGKFTRMLERKLAAAQARIAELGPLVKRLKHCEHCGDSWYDSGIINTSCPHCRIAFLKAAGKELENDAHRYRWLRRQNEKELGQIEITVADARVIDVTTEQLELLRWLRRHNNGAYFDDYGRLRARGDEYGTAKLRGAIAQLAALSLIHVVEDHVFLTAQGIDAIDALPRRKEKGCFKEATLGIEYRPTNPPRPGLIWVRIEGERDPVAVVTIEEFKRTYDQLIGMEDKLNKPKRS